MRRFISILALAVLFVAAGTQPLFAAAKKSPSSLSPATSTAARQDEPSKTTTSKTTDSRESATKKSTTRTLPSNRPATETTRPETTIEPQQPTGTAGTSADPIQLDWVSINHGGATEVSSGNLRMGLSIAQTVAGEVSSGDLKMGLGFWYGAAGVGDCLCSHQADLDSDGFPTNVDLGILIDIAFAGHEEIPNPGCPISRGDLDNSGYVDLVDIGWMIDYLFAGGSEPCDPCNPIQSICAP